jgi:hypothetical protein
MNLTDASICVLARRKWQNPGNIRFFIDMKKRHHFIQWCRHQGFVAGLFAGHGLPVLFNPE